jgi:tripartite-type tricarboxylate transporter receptor subunit TctC
VTGAKVIGAVALVALFAPAASAQDAIAAFYKDKQINFYIGYPAGGAYDAYARLVSRFMSNHIPGRPTITPRNMPGGGGHIAAGYVANVAAADGLSLATADNSMAIAQATGDAALTFDVRRLNFIGNPVVTNNVMVVWHTAPAKTIAQAKTREVTMGATGPSNPGAQYPRAANLMFGTKFRIINGYPGANDLNVAMEKGEIDGRGSNDWVGWKSSRPDWVRERKIIVLAQIGLAREPDLSDIPLAENDTDRAALRLMSSNVSFGKPVFTSPGVPPERIDALRGAFDATMKDPEFLAQAERQKLDIRPVAGVDLQKIAADVMADTPPAVIERLRRILSPEMDSGR